MARVEWTAAARLDLQELDEFLHEKNPEAAARAMLAIFEAADQIETMPESGRPAEGRAANERELVIAFGTGGYVVTIVSSQTWPSSSASNTSAKLATDANSSGLIAS
ncbi:type II toxin-antitoxin system RelE/ParE family toxin [Devosia insulae]|uniref:type II toxin-antitoxin system RelE/ParE family toxin n=1 Tax=Devosia insulae TaxID=408174 RepID=UPI0009FD0EAA|nr:type II toxin-antitoxin system RelE/ParE family toxin [Devosia insulae]